MTDVLEVESGRCEILTLVLKKKWFDLINANEKRAEYRTAPSVCRQIDRWFGHARINGKFPIVKFCLGYQKNRATMYFLAGDVAIGSSSDSPGWGEPDGWHYSIPLICRAKIVQKKEGV